MSFESIPEPESASAIAPTPQSSPDVCVGGLVHRFELRPLRPADLLDAEKLRSRLTADTGWTALRATLHVASAEIADAIAKWTRATPSSLPLVEAVVQPPGAGLAGLASLWLVQAPASALRVSARAAALDRGDWIWGVVPDVQSESRNGTAVEVESCFLELGKRLTAVGLAPQDLAKIWIYINQINGDEMGAQRYQGVNVGRRNYFEKIRFDRYRSDSASSFPASTGIGTSGTAVLLGGLACRPGADGALVPLENPSQTPASRYPSHVSAVPPLFSRAMVIVAPEGGLTFVSGTAGIAGPDSKHIGDPEGQTLLTLRNIEELLSGASIGRVAGVAASTGLESVLQATVFVAREMDVPIVARICRVAFPRNCPLAIVRAEICRPELLVEIECVAFTPWAEAPPYTKA